MSTKLEKSHPINIPGKRLHNEDLNNISYNANSYEFNNYICKTPKYNTPPNKEDHLIEKNKYSNNRDGPNFPIKPSPPDNVNLHEMYMNLYANIYLSNSLSGSSNLE